MCRAGTSIPSSGSSLCQGLVTGAAGNFKSPVEARGTRASGVGHKGPWGSHQGLGLHPRTPGGLCKEVGQVSG